MSEKNRQILSCNVSLHLEVHSGSKSVKRTSVSNLFLVSGRSITRMYGSEAPSSSAEGRSLASNIVTYSDSSSKLYFMLNFTLPVKQADANYNSEITRKVANKFKDISNITKAFETIGVERQTFTQKLIINR